MQLQLIITLLGWNYLKQLKLAWEDIFRVHPVQATETIDFEQLLSKYQTVFDKKLGYVLRTPARLYVNPGAKSNYKPRPVTYILKKKLKNMKLYRKK